jgi:hypothetical protein
MEVVVVGKAEVDVVVEVEMVGVTAESDVAVAEMKLVEVRVALEKIDAIFIGDMDRSGDTGEESE